MRPAIAALVLLTLSTPAFAAEAPGSAERVAHGARTFRAYCVSCHGKEARGDGPLAEVLKVPPTDLTRLTASHQGTFPYLEVRRAIDGRADVLAHGGREMPVWGLSLQCLDCDTDREAQVREQIEDLLAFLASIQKEIGAASPRSPAS